MPHLEIELEKLKALMLEMIGIVNAQIIDSLNYMLTFDLEGERSILFQEKQVNILDLRIDKSCENFMALYNPVAIDLRFVFSMLRINSNYERIGDNAVGIAKYTLLNNKTFESKLLEECRFAEMAACVTEMLDLIAAAYRDQDISGASKVFRQDSLLNEINKEATTVIARYGKQNPDNLLEALHLLTIIRKLERVGDHITNVAEEILFFVEARMVRHAKNLKAV